MSIKINAPEQQKEVLALCVVGRGGSSYTWSIGKYPNIIHATKAVRKAKRDFKLKGWQVVPVHILDISNCKNWAFDGYSVVDTDSQDKDSEAYKKGDIYNPYRGCKPLELIEVLDVVT